MLGLGLDYAFVPDWQKVPVAGTLRSSFGVEVALENNLRAIAIAERWFGGGRDLDDYVIVGPRSGFGVAIVHGGALFGGTHHAAGEIGRWPWPLGTQTRELHDELSSVAVWRRLSGASPGAQLPSNLHAALSKFAGASGAARESVVRDYAHVLGCLHLLLDSSAYLLHGPLTALGAPFCDEIVAEIAVLIPMLDKRLPRNSCLPNSATTPGPSAPLAWRWSNGSLRNFQPEGLWDISRGHSEPRQSDTPPVHPHHDSIRPGRGARGFRRPCRGGSHDDA